MLRKAWKMDDEYQKKSFYMSISAPVHSSHRMFSHRTTTLFFGFWTYRLYCYGANSQSQNPEQVQRDSPGTN